MTTSPNGRKFIEDLEGVRLKAYQDGGGVWTIGYGHILGVKSGDICSFDQADKWLSEDLTKAEAAVNKHVTQPLNQNQYDALVIFTFNVGVEGFETSTLLRLLNHGDTMGAANQFLLWVHIKGVFSPGLLNRRTAERQLFLTAMA